MALSALALVHPLLQLIGQNPEFFVAHGISGSEMLVMVLLLLLLPPCLAALVAAGLRPVSPQGHRLFVGLCVGLTTGALGLQAVKGVGALDGMFALGVGALAATLGGISYIMVKGARSFATALTAAIVIVPAVFLINPAVSQFFSKPAEELPTYRVDTKTPIVLVVFDSFPLASLLDANLRIDPVLYPSFAGLARDGIWFRNATTVATHTRWGVSGIVSGKYPEAAAIPNTTWYPDNFFTVFGATHQLNVLEPMTTLCPATLCPQEPKSKATRLSSVARDMAIVYLHVIMPDRWAADLPPLDEGWANFGGGGKAMAIRVGWVDVPGVDDRRLGPESFIRSMSASAGKPGLWFMHVVLPHNPFLYEPSGHSYGGERGTPKEFKEGFWIEDRVRVAQIYQRHLLQVGYVDSLLGQMIARLKEIGIYEDALIAVLADHGEGFQPGDRRRSITPANRGEVMAVPFIIKPPGVNRGQMIDHDAEAVDFMPTVAALLGVKLPYVSDGRSALEPGPPRSSRRVLALPYQAKTITDPDAYSVEDVPWNFQWVAEAVRRKLDLFEHGNPWKIKLHPHTLALGTDLTTFEVGDAPGVSVEAKGMHRFENVSLRNEQLPLSVYGTVSGVSGAAAPVALAVAVNGKIWANTVVLSDGSWRALVPPSALKDGSNDVDILVLSTSGESPSLSRPTINGMD